MNIYKRGNIRIIIILFMLFALFAYIISSKIINIANLPECTSDKQKYYKQLHPVGFPMLGNTCYANSSLQALLSLNSFVFYFESVGNRKLYNLIKLLIKEVENNTIPDKKNLKYLITRIKNSDDTFFVIGNQECASEFIQLLLNQVDQEINNEDGSIMDNFRFDTVTEFKCMECKTGWKGPSETVFPIYINKNISISEAIKSSMIEKIDDFKCEFCKKKVNIQAKRSFTSNANILMVVNKCYDYITKEKLHYTFNVNYNLLINNFNYVLSAIIIHIGSTINSGHYIALCKRNNSWYKINDTIWEKIPKKILLENIKQMEGYVFFYEKD
ncbi:Ubiquitin carboxyl-terminal hydrolase 12 [Astathelohania contejeani]|uniref:Ubiquitin carboxyl-terminal hydrolase 12 n=1 Tax=Astathelohania contejeani TaxID=164912 RepID=A0ABQ7HZV5_9MICR|nr:Ubiquitin carboxyl-terminal hydrolase 12 [Thelohania contejeani]